MSEPIDETIHAFATEDTYLHATDRVAEEAIQRLLVVEIGGERYGLPTDAVSEIIRIGEITEVPRLPTFLLGVISVRGAIIPVMCLRLRLGFSDGALGRAARIVIVSHGGQRFGLRVDGVIGLQRFRASSVESAPAIFGASRGGADRFISSVARVSDGSTERIVVFLELTALLAVGDELTAHRAQYLDHAARRRGELVPSS
jgi:purine-binding chemotaxis protein CheW